MKDDLRTLIAMPIYWHEEKSFREWGGLGLTVSTFDHRLTADEADARPMSYREFGRDKLDDYLVGERRWKSFYRELAADGAMIGNRQNDKLLDLAPTSGRLARVVRDSLRERRLMNVIFKRWPVRVLGGFDRTDLLLPLNREVRDRLEASVKAYGLFILESK